MVTLIVLATIDHFAQNNHRKTIEKTTFFSSGKDTGISPSPSPYKRKSGRETNEVWRGGTLTLRPGSRAHKAFLPVISAAGRSRPKPRRL
jgi:hypothetical protein